MTIDAKTLRVLATTMAKHAPGPWEVNEGAVTIGYLAVMRADGDPNAVIPELGECCEWSDEADADIHEPRDLALAHYIAALSPDVVLPLLAVDTAARAYVAARAASLASNDADVLAALIAATDALVAAVGAS